MLPYLHVPVYKFGNYFSVQAFGILIALGVVWGARLARDRSEKLGLDVNLALDAIFWSVVGGFFLSHVFSDLLYYPDKVLENPIRLLLPWMGISSFGGFLGGLLVLVLFFRWKKTPLFPYLDAMSYGFLPAFFLGRVGCAIAHDHPGVWFPGNPLHSGDVGLFYSSDYSVILVQIMPLDSLGFWLAIAFVGLWVGFLWSRLEEKPFFRRDSLVILVGTGMLAFVLHPFLGRLLKMLTLHWPVRWWEDATHAQLQTLQLIWAGGSFPTHPRYDLGLLEALWLGCLTWASFRIARGKPRREGFFLAFWFVAYAPIRFVMDTLRVDEVRYGGLTPGQYLSLLTGILGLWLFWNMPQRRWEEPLTPKESFVEKEV
ncbi:MAG: prolipoprotein diacylglyceryl transferase [Myxococcales bacterium]|nr:prolipoprotein diacylglyceryl transferase [Myxococcales bacterium]MCB9643079.1 prolipoprotein diacylglyceryl transferase [Myxococcales bacterium]